jgi:hypothetical protein
MIGAALLSDKGAHLQALLIFDLYYGADDYLTRLVQDPPTDRACADVLLSKNGSPKCRDQNGCPAPSLPRAAQFTVQTAFPPKLRSRSRRSDNGVRVAGRKCTQPETLRLAPVLVFLFLLFFLLVLVFVLVFVESQLFVFLVLIVLGL